MEKNPSPLTRKASQTPIPNGERVWNEAAARVFASDTVETRIA